MHLPCVVRSCIILRDGLYIHDEQIETEDMTMSTTKINQRNEELAKLKQRIEELEKEAAAFVQPCDCCGKDIQFGSACVEFMRMVNQTDIDADGIITATPIDDDIVALICADCGNRYSDARSIRKELGNELGITDLKEIPPDGSAVALLADQDHECDYCGKNM
jgi:hypothetical protein